MKNVVGLGPKPRRSKNVVLAENVLFTKPKPIREYFSLSTIHNKNKNYPAHCCTTDCFKAFNVKVGDEPAWPEKGV